jgi:hypothetical protein
MVLPFRYVFAFLFVVVIGCTTNLSASQEQGGEEFERTVSYQDIIAKINDVNTKNKNNKRMKEIVKEYKYNTGDDDSKNSAREKALNQVKIIILEEIGVFVEGYLEINKVVADKKYQSYFKQEIKNLTAGVIKTKILDEKYDGKSYYVKASCLVDPDSVSEGISEILKVKANQGEIKKLNELMVSKEKEIDMRSAEAIALQKKIANQTLLNQAKEEELKTIQVQLQKAQEQLGKYQQEEMRLQGELGQVQAKVNQAMQRIKSDSQKACMMTNGMTKREVQKAIGWPSGKTYNKSGSDCYDTMAGNCQEWYYGSVVLHFENNGLLSSGSGCR